MFLPTMNNEEILREARKDFFELSGKIRMCIERFANNHAKLLNNSGLQCNNIPVSLITKQSEQRQWRTRQRNIWHSLIYVNHKSLRMGGTPFFYYLYTVVHRATGREFIMLSSLDTFSVMRFTIHFTERYKERHLAAHNINIGNTPAVIHFLIKNEQEAFPGVYYKTTDIGEEATTNKRFWICPEGIYVTDIMDGMLTYLTFLDKSDLTELKKQVYEEEYVWHLIKTLMRIKDKDPVLTSRLSYEIYHTEGIDRILTRFSKRNLDISQKEMVELAHTIYENYKNMKQNAALALAERDKREQQLMRQHRLSSSSDVNNIHEIEIKEYDLNKLRGL